MLDIAQVLLCRQCYMRQIFHVFNIAMGSIYKDVAICRLHVRPRLYWGGGKEEPDIHCYYMSLIMIILNFCISMSTEASMQMYGIYNSYNVTWSTVVRSSNRRMIITLFTLEGII